MTKKRAGLAIGIAVLLGSVGAFGNRIIGTYWDQFGLAATTWVAIQVEQTQSASGATIGWEQQGSSTASGSFVTSYSTLEQLGSEPFGNSKLVGQLSAGTYYLKGTGPIIDQRVAIGLPATGMVPQQLGNGAHSEPRVVSTDGSIIKSHITVSSERVFVSVDDVYIGEIFSDLTSSEIDTPDVYHRAVTFARTSTGLLAVHTSHSKNLAYRWVAWNTDLATTAGDLCAATSAIVSTAPGYTYSRLAVSTDGDTVHVMTRYTGSGNEQYPCILKLTGFGGTITATHDIWADGNRAYPRAAKVLVDGDGNDVLACAWAGRSQASNRWDGCYAAFLQTNTNQLYNINGATMGGTSNGTSGTPRISTYNNDYSAGGPALLYSGSILYYVPAVGLRLHGWTTGGREAEATFPFIAGDASEIDGYDADGIDYRMGVVRGSSRVVTTAKASGAPAVFSGLNSVVTFRLGSHVYYDGDTVNVLSILGDTSGINAANDYVMWGATGNASDEATCKHFTIDLSGSLPTMDTAVTNAGDITVTCLEGQRFMDIGQVGGDEPARVYHTGVGYINLWDPQGTMEVDNLTTTTYYAVAPAGYSYSGAEDARYSTRKYNTLSAAEAALEASPTGPQIIEIIGDWTSAGADTTAVTFAGVTTTSDNYVSVMALGDARHEGAWSTSKYRLEVANASAITVTTTAYVYFDGLLIGKSSSSANNQACIRYASGVPTTNEQRISNCILRQAGNASFYEPVIRYEDADSNMKVWNSVLYGMGANSSDDNSAIFGSNGTLSVYSSVLIGGRHAVYGFGGTRTLKNCYGYATPSGAFTGTLTTCASSDTSGSAGLQSIAHDTSTFVNVTAGSQDYHLASGSPLIDVGTDTSGDTAPLNFTDDIDGDTRTTWDVGADDGATSLTYVIAEDMEGTGTPTGWTDTGTVDWDNATAGSGSESLALTGGSNYSYYSVSDAGEYEAVFKFRVSNVPSGSSKTLAGFRSADGSTAVCLLRETTGRNLAVFVDGADSTATTNALSDNTWYWIKLRWVAGGTCSVEFVAGTGDTTPTFTGSGNSYQSRNDTSSAAIGRFYMGFNHNANTYFDQVLVAQEAIPAGEAP